MTTKTAMETTPKRRDALKVKLSDEDLRTRININTIPELDANGKVRIRPRPAKDAGKPYYILIEGGPTGFGVYVGLSSNSYKLTVRGPSGLRRTSLGSVFDLSLEEAMDKARADAKVIRETGDNPQRQKKIEVKRETFKRITVAGCFELYIKHLGDLKRKPSSIGGVRDSLARLAREDVGIADKEVRDISLDPEIALTAIDKVRRSAQKRSNLIPTHMLEALKAQDVDWQDLDTKTLEAMGIKGKYVQRVRAAGLAAAEHTMTDAIRAVSHAISEEAERAIAEDRKPDLFSNPFLVLYKKEKFRDAMELRRHYEKSKTRNPLEDKSLPKVLKAIVARRDEQGGMNRGAADYLLLTLLFGTRRGENAQLKWFDRCSEAELLGREVSWVWLPSTPDEINPYTQRSGAQVYYHDTKNGDERFLPVCYFAERVLQQRLVERQEVEAAAPARIRDAEKAYKELKKQTIDTIKLAKAKRKVDIEVERPERGQWVFPARSHKAKKGHYSDSKSILHNIRTDAGLLDLDKEIDIGLTPHDLRRTLGRYAAAMHRGPVVSQMLNHRVPEMVGERMAEVSKIYTQQEWETLRKAFGETEETMIASSPRVWNRLKGTDKPRLDESNDPPAEIFKAKKQMMVEEE